MGNSASSGSARRKLGDAVQTHVFQRSLPEPLKPHEIGERIAKHIVRMVDILIRRAGTHQLKLQGIEALHGLRDWAHAVCSCSVLMQCAHE